MDQEHFEDYLNSLEVQDLDEVYEERFFLLSPLVFMLLMINASMLQFTIDCDEGKGDMRACHSCGEYWAIVRVRKSLARGCSKPLCFVLFLAA